jgi:hypothetical protein
VGLDFRKSSLNFESEFKLVKKTAIKKDSLNWDSNLLRFKNFLKYYLKKKTIIRLNYYILAGFELASTKFPCLTNLNNESYKSIKKRTTESKKCKLSFKIIFMPKNCDFLKKNRHFNNFLSIHRKKRIIKRSSHSSRS